MCKIKNNEKDFVGGAAISGGRSLQSNLNAGSKCGPHPLLLFARFDFGWPWTQRR
jgi:hypothetical protein